MKCQTAHFLVVTRIMACEIAFGISPALFQLPIFHQNGQPEDLQTCFKGVEGLKLYNLQTKHTHMNSSGKFDIFIYLFIYFLSLNCAFQTWKSIIQIFLYG